MKHTNGINLSLLLVAFLLGIALHTFAFAEAVNVNIASDAADPFWQVYDASGKPITDVNGNPIPPQNVCLNDNSPPNCPAGAMKYEHVSPGDWPTNLKDIPGAKWIWAPNITGQTSPAGNAEFTFTHDFPLCNPLRDGTIYIAVDDSAEVYLNGSPVPVLTTTSNSLKSITIPKNALVKFEFPMFKKNTIKIKARNAYLEWCDPLKTKVAKDNYQCNPAGIVFGTSFPDDARSCTGSHGETLQHGESEPCPKGQIGSAGYCACGTFYPFNTCKLPPPTCSGINGKTYQVNESEALPCIAPKVGSASRTCQPNGWGPTDYSTCEMTCSGSGGKTYRVNEAEALPCPAPKVGSASRTCQVNGAWGAPNYSACHLPVLGVGDMCASAYPNWVDYGTCPSGTDCRRRRTCTQDCPWWDWSGLFCSETCLVTTDLYCDPH